MKKLTLISIFIMFSVIVFAQWLQNENDIYYNNGNVGIGTSTPGDYSKVPEFVLYGNQGDNGMTIASPTNAAGKIHFADGTIGNEQYRGYIIYQHDHDALRFGVAAIERMRIDNTGNVGIGTISPGDYTELPKFVLYGNQGDNGMTIVSPTNAAGKIHFADGTTEKEQYRGYIIYHHNRDALKFGTSAKERMSIDKKGNVGIGIKNPGKYNKLPKLVINSNQGDNGMTIVSPTTAAGKIHFADGTNGDEQYRGYIIYQHDLDALRFGSAGEEKMRINNVGNIGIGITNPISKLHISTDNTGITPYHGTTIFTERDEANVIQVISGNGHDGVLMFGDTDDNFRGTVHYNHSNDKMTFFTAGTSQVEIDNDGNLEIRNPDRGIYLTSPDGSKWKLTVDNYGNLTVSEPIRSSIQELAIETNIYPNPASDFINVQIETNDYKYFNAELYAIDGNMIFMRSYSSNKFIIELADFQKGAYLLKVRNQNGYVIASQKVFKN